MKSASGSWRSQTEPFAEGDAVHKVYLVPDGDQLAIISKTDHSVCNGLSIMQMWSMLQDGTPEHKWQNRVRFPERQLSASFREKLDVMKF
jgi:hypothetical protein